jgi:hypothetical protein
MILSEDERKLLNHCLLLWEQVAAVGLTLKSINFSANDMVMDLVSKVLIESSETLLNYESSILKATDTTLEKIKAQEQAI